MDDRWWTQLPLTVDVKEAAQITGFSEWAIRQAMKDDARHHLPSAMPNGHRRGTRIKRCDLKEWYDSLGE